jgi:hypothetical protein
MSRIWTRPFFEVLDRIGLPTRVKDAEGDRPWNA